jgi:hypothetical protein
MMNACGGVFASIERPVDAGEWFEILRAQLPAVWRL